MKYQIFRKAIENLEMKSQLMKWMNAMSKVIHKANFHLMTHLMKMKQKNKILKLKIITKWKLNKNKYKLKMKIRLIFHRKWYIYIIPMMMIIL